MRAFFLYFTLGCVGLSGCGSDTPPVNQPSKVAYLNQAWSDQDRADYYWGSQGSALISYDIYLALQLPNSSELFNSALNADRMGLLVDEDAAINNPDQLPIGVAKTVVSSGQYKGAYMGLTCAACHTGQLQYQGQQIRVDGGTSNRFTIVPWLQLLANALNTTLNDPVRFQAMLRTIQKSGNVDEGELRYRLEKDALNVQTQIDKVFHIVDQPGPGRMDAIGSIHNTLAWLGTSDQRNLYSTTAPVKPPFLWNAPQSSWIEWSGVAANPLTRNMSESLGVFARFDLHSARPEEGLFDTTSDVKGIVKIENMLRRLAPPKWPEHIFGPLNQERVRQGQQLFSDNCSGCHTSYPYRWTPPRGTSGKQFIDNRIVPQSIVGTDNTQLVSVTFSSVIKVFIGNALALALNLGIEESSLEYQRAVQTKIIDKAVNKAGPFSVDEYNEMTSYASMAEAPPPLGYKAAPRDGAWSTGPFLHNGAVPNLYELLSPAAARSKQFYVTREFDPIKLGVNTAAAKPGDYLLDTSLVGNSNAGHSFENGSGAGVIGREFMPDERWAIIEYIKSIPNVEGRITPYGGPR